MKSYGYGLKINRYCRFTSNCSVKNNCNFNGISVSGGGILEIGNNFHSGKGCRILLGSHDYDHGEAIPYGKKMTVKNVTIDDNVWLGDNVIISGNIHIGEGAVIGIGAVVVKDVPAFAVVGGNPARIIKYRDIDHYISRKTNKMFH